MIGDLVSNELIVCAAVLTSLDGHAMKRRRIEYREHWYKSSPMAYWVHLAVDNNFWAADATLFEPPAPSPIPGKGFPVYFVEFDGFVFCFSSLDEMDVCISTLGQKNLPNVESEWRGRTGPGAHWLNRLPGHVLPWTYRKQAVEYLKESRDEFASANQT